MMSTNKSKLIVVIQHYDDMIRFRAILSSNGAYNTQLSIGLIPNSTLSKCKNLRAYAFSTRSSRRTVTKEKRSALRAARKQQVAQDKQSTSVSSASTSNTATFSSSQGSLATGSPPLKKPWDPRVVFGLGLGIPTFLLGWGIFDDSSPPAKFARMIGLTDTIENFAEDFNRPSRPKLIPDWAHVSLVVIFFIFISVLIML